MGAVLEHRLDGLDDCRADARRRDAKIRGHLNLYDPGRRAAELRRASGGDLRDCSLGRAVLQRIDPGQPERSRIADRLRLRSVHRNPAADRGRQDLRFQDPRRRQIPRRLAADRLRRGGELAQNCRPAGGRDQRPPELLHHGRQDRDSRPADRGLRSQISDQRVSAGARRSLHLDLQEGNPRQGSPLVREEHHGLRPVQVRRLPSRSIDHGQTSKEELQQIAGYWPDIEKSRTEARRLLKEAGADGLTFELLNRSVDQPFKHLGIWLVDEWGKIGVKATQRVLPTGPWFEGLRNGSFDVAIEGNCQSVINPVLDVSKYQPRAVFTEQYGDFDDPDSIDLYQRMLHETDPAKQRRLMREFEKHAL